MVQTKYRGGRQAVLGRAPTSRVGWTASTVWLNLEFMYSSQSLGLFNRKGACLLSAIKGAHAPRVRAAAAP
jgi:hypothetical protein